MHGSQPSASGSTARSAWSGTLLAIAGVALAATVSVKGGIFLTVTGAAMAAAAVNGTLHMSPRFLRRVSNCRTD